MLCPVLIDRGAEFHALTSALDGARDGAGCVLFLTGDAGIGKSRLAREVTAQAAERGFLVLAGRAAESVVPMPFRPITEALMKAARSGLAPDAPEMAGYRPSLGALVPEWGSQEGGEPEVSPIMLAEALLRLLTAPGRPGALLVLEDLHWADPETLATLDYLADNLPGTRLLCVATVRDSEPSAGLDLARAVVARRAATLVEVPRLTERSVSQMAAACLGADEAPAGVRRLLADCDGLPFAVEEILATATASGQLVKGASGWQVSEGVSTAVPASILGSVRNRLAALGPVVTDVLASAAVLGRQFDWTMLPAVANVAEPEVLAALQQAQEVQLITPIGGNGRFWFRHSLTRQAILSDLLPPDLARRSARAAAAIETAHPGLPGSWCELAAELHEAAGDRVRAANLMLQVGRRAVRQGALHSAAASLRDAHDLLSQAPPGQGQHGQGTHGQGTHSQSPSSKQLANEIDEALVHALALTGDYDQLAPVAEQLIARLRRAGAEPRRQALIRIMTARAGSEDHPEAAARHLTAARRSPASSATRSWPAGWTPRRRTARLTPATLMAPTGWPGARSPAPSGPPPTAGRPRSRSSRLR